MVFLIGFPGSWSCLVSSGISLTIRGVYLRCEDTGICVTVKDADTFNQISAHTAAAANTQS